LNELFEGVEVMAVDDLGELDGAAGIAGNVCRQRCAGALGIGGRFEHAGEAFFEEGWEAAFEMAGDELMKAFVGGDGEGGAVAEIIGDVPVVESEAAAIDLEIDGGVVAGVRAREGRPLLARREDVAVHRAIGERDVGGEVVVLIQTGLECLRETLEEFFVGDGGVDEIVRGAKIARGTAFVSPGLCRKREGCASDDKDA
jgi:hypothetical protein